MFISQRVKYNQHCSSPAIIDDDYHHNHCHYYHLAIVEWKGFFEHVQSAWIHILCICNVSSSTVSSTKSHYLVQSHYSQMSLISHTSCIFHLISSTHLIIHTISSTQWLSNKFHFPHDLLHTFNYIISSTQSQSHHPHSLIIHTGSLSTVSLFTQSHPHSPIIETVSLSTVSLGRAFASLDTHYNIHWFFMWPAKALICLYKCAGWSRPSLSKSLCSKTHFCLTQLIWSLFFFAKTYQFSDSMIVWWKYWDISRPCFGGLALT